MNAPTPPGKLIWNLVTNVRHEIPKNSGYAVKARPELGRHPQTEARCPRCGAIRVTVHPPEGEGWRMWRVSEEAVEQVMDAPECVFVPGDKA